MGRWSRVCYGVWTSGLKHPIARGGAGGCAYAPCPPVTLFPSSRLPFPLLPRDLPLHAVAPPLRGPTLLSAPSLLPLLGTARTSILGAGTSILGARTSVPGARTFVSEIGTSILGIGTPVPAFGVRAVAVATTAPLAGRRTRETCEVPVPRWIRQEQTMGIQVFSP